MPKREFWLVLCAVGVYLLLGFLLLPSYSSRLNPDGLSYLHLAQEYVDGAWSNAITSYWAPMFSWILALFLVLGIDPSIVGTFTALLTGVDFLVASALILRMLHLPRAVLWTVWAALIPMTLFFAFSVVTPDLLLAAILLYYVWVLLQERHRWEYGVLCGVLGGCAYLTKNVALPIFLLHFTAASLLQSWLQPQLRRFFLTRFCVGMMAFVCIVVPWIAIISAEDGHLTIGTAGRIIHASEGPGRPGLSMLSAGLMPPPFEGAHSIWDDPSHMQVTPWSPLREPVHQIKQIILHLIDLQNVLLSFSWFAIVILAGIIVYLPRRGSVGTDSSLFALTILTLAVLAALYLPILVDGRYFWVCSTLLLCAGALFTGRLFREASLVPWQRLVVLLFLWASFAVYPLGSLVHLFRDGEVLAAQVMEFTAAYPLTSTRIAADSWKQGLYVSGYSDAVFYGVPRKSASTEEMERELLMHGIQYYLTWREPMGTFRSYSLLPASTLPGVGVYIRSDE